MGCNFECLSTYNCREPFRPYRDAILAPYVSIGFGGDFKEITVGNDSSPPDNHAMILSMEYGVSEGNGVKIEILDEEGGKFRRVIDRLNKSIALADNNSNRMFLEFGWIKQDCQGNISRDVTTYYGGILAFLLMSIEVNFEGSKIRYSITGKDLGDRIAENRLEKNEGREDHKKSLKQAISDMYKNNYPRVKNIKFIKSDESTWNFKNSDGGPNGPYAVWTTDQQNALAVSRKWIAPLSTRDDRGVLIRTDPTDPDSLIFLEDPIPGPDENPDCCKTNVGTFIVNGGNCGDVISFTPSFSWVLANNGGSGGGAGGGASGNNVKNEGRKDSNKEKVGVQTHIIASQNATMYRPNDQIIPKEQDANANHDDAVRIQENKSAIEAELKIIGNPIFAHPFKFIAKSVSIIVVNPFSIIGGGDCMWLAQPPCNEILSNKAWMIKGINHQIRGGSYVTIIKLFLAAPNSEVEIGEPLGGIGCGVYTPPNISNKGD
jgi:hypothetical protein